MPPSTATFPAPVGRRCRRTGAAEDCLGSVICFRFRQRRAVRSRRSPPMPLPIRARFGGNRSYAPCTVVLALIASDRSLSSVPAPVGYVVDAFCCACRAGCWSVPCWARRCRRGAAGPTQPASSGLRRLCARRLANLCLAESMSAATPWCPATCVTRCSHMSVISRSSDLYSRQS